MCGVVQGSAWGSAGRCRGSAGAVQRRCNSDAGGKQGWYRGLTRFHRVAHGFKLIWFRGCARGVVHSGAGWCKWCCRGGAGTVQG